MALGIHLEWTPNPNTLKYVLNCPLLPAGSMSFSSREQAKALSPLADKLLGLPGVAEVTLGGRFVSVTKTPEGEWVKTNDAVVEVLEGHLGGGEAVLTQEGEAYLEAQAKRDWTEVEARIEEVLEAEIRPALAMDGGGVTLERFEGGIAYVHMRGACAGCPSAQRTLKMGIEVRLKEAVPELQEVVAL
jgi:Fe-S cluster biogenesis protein NfuA